MYAMYVTLSKLQPVKGRNEVKVRKDAQHIKQM